MVAKWSVDGRGAGLGLGWPQHGSSRQSQDTLVIFNHFSWGTNVSNVCLAHFPADLWGLPWVQSVARAPFLNCPYGRPAPPKQKKCLACLLQRATVTVRPSRTPGADAQGAGEAAIWWQYAALHRPGYEPGLPQSAKGILQLHQPCNLHPGLRSQSACGASMPPEGTRAPADVP